MSISKRILRALKLYTEAEYIAQTKRVENLAYERAAAMAGDIALEKLINSSAATVGQTPKDFKDDTITIRIKRRTYVALMTKSI